MENTEGIKREKQDLRALPRTENSQNSLHFLISSLYQ